MEFEQLLPCGFPFFFVGMWVMVSWLIAMIGGWSRLAGHYRASSDFLGQTWNMCSGRMGISNYNGVLTIGANSNGLHLAVLLPFRVGHPPLFIPWEEISTTPVKNFWVAYTELRFAAVPGVTLRLREKFAQRVLAYSSDPFHQRPENDPY
jgi:hypothetical protein